MVSITNHYTPITLKAGEPIPANAVVDFTGQWYLEEPVVSTERDNPFRDPSDPLPDSEFEAAEIVAAWDAYYEMREESRVKADKAYQAYLAKSNEAYEARMRELDF